VQRIGHSTLEMLDDAMQAYSEEVAERAYAVSKRDTEIDAMCEAANEAVVRDLINQEALSETDIGAIMSDVSRLLLTVRDLERVGDHAVNIAARSLYMIENDDELLY
jgi:Phosphate uptake regulator